MMLPFAAPLGNFGLPGFLLVFFASVTFSELLYDGGSYGCFRRYHGWNVQRRDHCNLLVGIQDVRHIRLIGITVIQ